jgi:hypothetical protein
MYYLTQCNAGQSVKKALGEKDVEAILQRLDRLAPDEARTTTAGVFNVVYGLVQDTSE